MSLEDKVLALEKRATEAEALLKKATSSSAAAPAADDKITVAKLQQLQKLIAEDKAEADLCRAQRQELKEENEKLKALVDKGEYRILHLLRLIEEMEKKQ